MTPSEDKNRERQVKEVNDTLLTHFVFLPMSFNKEQNKHYIGIGK